MANIPWTEPEDQTARAMWNDRASFGAISDALPARSRNAVIGYLHRKGLFREPPQVVSAQKRKDEYNMKRREKRASEPSSVKTTFNDATINSIRDKRAERAALIWNSPERIDPNAIRVTLLDRDPNGCAFPFGSENFTFCNARRLDGLSYCGFHCRIVYASPRERH